MNFNTNKLHYCSSTQISWRSVFCCDDGCTSQFTGMTGWWSRGLTQLAVSYCVCQISQA